jgi:hypothetical protein
VLEVMASVQARIMGREAELRQNRDDTLAISAGGRPFRSKPWHAVHHCGLERREGVCATNHGLPAFS